ncbi:MAG: hypothetical protein ACLP66_24305 [Polyangia bacterium]
MVPMVARLRIVLSCLVVASLGACGGGSHSTSSQDALTIVVDMGGSTGTGGGPDGVGGGSGGTGGQLATTTSAAPGVCVPGASVACACVTGQQGAQTCTSAGTFAPCVCAPPAVDAGATGGSDGAATSPPDAPAASGGSDGATAADEARFTDAPVATGGVDASDAPFATGDTGAGDTPGTGTTPAIVSFTASPPTIFIGQPSTLSWTVTGATTLTIDQGAGSALITVLGETSQVVTPTQTTTYTLTLNGSVSARVTVAVSNGVTFSNGQAQGQMNGLGWVGMGVPGDNVTDPTCGTTPPYQQITAAAPCTTQTHWNSPSALCITGAIPALGTPPDYTGNWGLELGVYANSDGVSAIGTAFASINVAVTGPVPGLRVNIHRKGDPGTSSYLYCALYTGSAIPLTNFNTACWDNSGTAFTAADAPKIDRVILLVPSSGTAITVTNLCMTGITFN